jgi:chromosome partitioning protein
MIARGGRVERDSLRKCERFVVVMRASDRWRNLMATTIAFANQKGGCGKTTSAVNLSAALGRLGYRVLLVDLDAQAGATQNCFDTFGEAGAVVADVLLKRATLVSIIRPTEKGFDLAPSNLDLASLDKDLAGKSGPDIRLKIALEDVAKRYDFIFLDCPGWLGMATLNGLAAADYVCIVIDCKPQSFETVNKLYGEIREMSEVYRRAIGVLALPTFFEKTLNLSKEIMTLTKERFESATLSPIHKNTRLSEAYYQRQTIFEYDPQAPGAMDYLRVAKELIDVAKPQTRLGRGTTTAEG